MTSSNSREMKQKLSGFKTEVANSMNISLNQGCAFAELPVFRQLCS